MIKNFNKFSMNESNQEKVQALIDQILDKINDYGYDNLSAIEKEILNKSTKGVDALDEYIDKDDDEKVTFDNGQILVNGLTYTEWQNRQKNKEDNKFKNDWSKTSRGSTKGKKPDYSARVYKNNNSNVLDYFLIWDPSTFKELSTDEYKKLKGTVKKYSTEKLEKNPYGIMTTKNIWEKKSIDQLHEQYFDKIYDKYRDLTIDELNLFETFMILRQRFKKNILNDEKDLKNLENLYNKFSRL